MRRKILDAALVAASAAGVLWLSAVQAQADHFAGRLSVVPIDPQSAANISGEGRIMAELNGHSLSIRGTFSGLQGAATEAQLRSGIATGVRGAPIADLAVDGDTTGSIDATVELTDEQVEALQAGRIYVQLHSEKAPDGNLWGWLLP